MTNDSQRNDEQLEEIVAYLDGELPPDECARVERRLASDEDFRQQLQSVERAWSALDELPLPTVDDKFSRTTMTMAVQAAAEEVQAKTTALPVLERRRRLSTALTAVAAVALGFLAVRLAWHDPNAALVADLPVIDNLDIYAQVRDAGFLRSLRGEITDQFEELAGESSDLSVRLKRFQTVATSDQRDAWLRALSPAERTNLRAKANRFRDLPPEEQDRLRKLHAEVAAPDADDLRQTLLIYQQWLRGLPPDRQFELRSMGAPDRVDTIRQWAAEMRDDSLFALSEAELRSLFQSVREPLADIRRVVTRNVEFGGNRAKQGRGDRAGERDRGDDRNRDGDRSDGRDRDRGRPGNFFSQPFMQYRRELTNRLDPAPGDSREFYQAVLAALPERTRDPFEQLSRRDKVERFLTWMRQYSASMGDISQQDLERFFAEELDARTQAELLRLPPGEMEQALKWRYRRQPNSGFPGRWWLGPPGGSENWNGPWQDGPRRRGPGRPPDFGPPPFRPPGDGPPDAPPDDARRGFGGPRPGEPGFDDRDGPRPFGEDDRRGPPRRGPGPPPGPPEAPPD
jgi:hypothetical protein